MNAYFSMFLIPVIALLFPMRGNAYVKRLSFLLVGVYFVILIGFRYEVGADWFSYLNIYEKAYGRTLFEYLSLFGWRDPGYFLLNWFSAQIGGGIIFVNIICAGIATLGLIAFCRKMPLPWLGIAIGVSYYLVVIAIGYTRQSAAIGIFMIILSIFSAQNFWRCLILAIVAILFHLSALLIIPILALSYSGKRQLIVAFIAFGIAIVLGLAYSQHINALWSYYIVSRMLHSGGGLIRVLMNAFPAFLLLLYRKKLLLDEEQPNLWITMAILALLCLPATFVASTAIDRIALYFIPLQIFVFTRIHRLFTNPYLRAGAVLFVIFYYGYFLWFWLNFGDHAESWLPYKFALFQNGGALL
jgi:hypothetical protein